MPNSPMERIELTGTSVALDADGLANDVAYSGGGYALTANDAGDSLAHLITILGNAATNHSGKTFTVTGTDAAGRTQSEGIAGPNGIATVTTTKHFKTVTSPVTVSATTGADTFDIGWSAVAVTEWVPMYRGNAIFNFGCTVGTGTPTYTVQHSYDGVAVFNHATVAAETTSQEGSYTGPISLMRLYFSAAGQVSLTGFGG